MLIDSLDIDVTIDYRFSNHPGYAWRRFLTTLSAETAKKVSSLPPIIVIHNYI
ncbi:hypothetical protein SBF1_110037 [Candidatus Desulfosporosinus infrequens]|uniref:Uncharacterized protein n=1 Tax=Candidatus Desulfosporosinus infrequens TaxID=2043169 RepID=A0A2U3JX04_9FIRM|nr:hypothetical protein SBF1_110037 [Candidatus Desulfosporosinus infrequens]